MADYIESFGISREARISIILNTFMYIDKCPKCDAMPTLRNAVSELLRDSTLKDEQRAALRVMCKCLNITKDSEIWDFQIISFSEHLEEKYRGAYAAAFKKADDSEMYIVFRGTGTGRWYDNGDGLANERTRYQLAALLYFNHVMSSLRAPDNVKLIVTGHSKGGNLSQYVMLASEYGSRIRYCISFDGQGFSPEFLKRINYPESNVSRLCNRMYSICGDNDYVNVLGRKVIPDDQTVFIKTKTRLTDLYGAHSIVPQGSGDVDDHWCDYLFNFTSNSFNEQTVEQRELANCAKAVSLNAMDMPHDEREDVCRTLMTLAERFIGGSNSSGGLNGEKAELEESVGFVTNLCEIIRPLTLRISSKVKSDVIYSLLVIPAGKGADPNMGSAPVEQKIKYILSDPEIMKLYCIGASIAVESLADNISQAGSVISFGGGEEFSSVIEQLVGSCDNAVDTVSSSCGSSDSDISGVLSSFLSMRNRFLRQSDKGEHSALGTSYSEWKNYLSYQNSEGKSVTRVSCTQRNILGDDTDEVIHGYPSDDTIHGYGGNDVIYGGGGNDAIYGAGGNDEIYGEDGDDALYGGDDPDSINGGEGDDLIRGGGGDDILCGGPGNDTYLFSPGCGRDTISDSEGCNTILFSKVMPSQLRSSINSCGELLIEMQGTADCIRIKNYSSGRYRFVFGEDNYVLTGQGSELAFIRQ